MTQRTAFAWLALACAGVFLAPLCAVGEAPGRPQPIVLKAARLFDSVSGRLQEPGIVLVEGARIQAVGADTRIPDNAQVIELGDATLLPGFIDAHVHLSQEASDRWYEDWYSGVMRFPAEQALYGAHYAKAVSRRFAISAPRTTFRWGSEMPSRLA